MASKRMIARNRLQERLIEQYREQRAELKAIWLDTSRSPEDREHANRQLRKLPRDSNPTRRFPPPRPRSPPRKERTLLRWSATASPRLPVMRASICRRRSSSSFAQRRLI